jgi:AcrR family transcriptional regulator
MENSSAKRAPKAQRRSHAERSAETRAKIIDAVVDSISDVGFQATTATEISNRAGVTWGAVQHHFGGKDGILEAVLEDTLSRFAARLADIPKSGPLEERVSLFIDRCWEHYRSPHYRSTFEILLNLMPKAVAAGGTSRHLQALDQLDELWTQIFADVELPRAERLGLESYTVAVLSGLASHLMLLGKQPAPFRREVELLKTAVLRGLRGKSD